MRLPHRPATVLVTVVLAVTAVAACGSDEAATPTDDAATAPAGPADDPAATGAAQAGAPAPSSPAGPAELPVVPAEAGHLHGIGVDPADGRVLLGTHVGLMAIGPDGVALVGDATTDLMGFTVAGPQHYYASGHPGPGDDLPNPVGLIETTDGGLTWRALSRAGESDFHTLVAGGGRVYGFDGVVRSSSDGVGWEDGAVDVAPVSLAVDPDDPDVVVATTQQGPVRSDDAGSTFALVDGAPLLVFLAWATAGELWGVDPEGGVHLSADGGTTWASTGAVGAPPEAFTATADGAVLVATGEHVLRSEDGGRTFEVVALRG
jgi:hypothetical protein